MARRWRRRDLPAVSPATSVTELLEIEDLQTQFKTGQGVVHAVDGVSLTLGSGIAMGIVGESGSGKSMTALSILRLIESPGAIVGGHIYFDGQDLLGLSEREMTAVRGSEISYVAQNPMSALNPVYTVGSQMIETIRAHQRIDGAGAKEQAVALLRSVGITAPEQRIGSYPHAMSGGMLQRVTIAMALANSPKLLILDEPTTALDVTIQAQILDLVTDLRAEINAAVLLITHDIGVVAEVCEQVIVMYSGKVMEQGSISQLMTDPKHPYTVALLASRPSLGTRGQRLNSIPGSVPSPFDMPPGCPFAPRCPDVHEACSRPPEMKRLENGRRVACWLY
jgi:peptide/nickel transport system ATP-binding protein